MDSMLLRVMLLFHYKSQMMSKCGQDEKVALAAQLSVSFTYLPYFDILCDLSLYKHAWN